MRSTIPGERIRGSNLAEEEYICGRCGMQGRSRRSRLYDTDGRRKVAYCADCVYWVAADEKARRQREAS